MNVIGRKNIFLTVSAILVAAAVIAMIVFRFHEGIDFSGGTLWRFAATGAEPGVQEIESFFKSKLGVSDARVTYDETNKNFFVRTSPITETDHQKFVALLKDRYPRFEELSFQSIGPSVGEELRRKSLIAVSLVLVGISLYIAFAFRKVYRPVSSWKYGWITLITLFHDVAIPAGLMAILGYFLKLEIDTNFIVALLVVMGFSVHDTIVVFDRIRENLFLDQGRTDFGEVVNRSVNQTLARSINTSLTLILVLFALLLAGPVSLRYFILTLLVGVTTGIYSSIFVASPLLIVWHNFSRKPSR